MKSPVVIVAITLTAAILVAASLLIFVGTRKGQGTSKLNAPALQQRLKHAHWSKIIRKLCARPKAHLKHTARNRIAMAQCSVSVAALPRSGRSETAPCGWDGVRSPVRR